MHLSAALGVPVVSLWGATSPARSAPFGSETLVVPGWASCAPCYLEECRIGRVCMQAIGAEEVLDRASDVLRPVAGSAGP
jgi:ADP-heptose:LPS heptosyltransferase